MRTRREPAAQTRARAWHENAAKSRRRPRTVGTEQHVYATCLKTFRDKSNWSTRQDTVVPWILSMRTGRTTTRLRRVFGVLDEAPVRLDLLGGLGVHGHVLGGPAAPKISVHVI